MNGCRKSRTITMLQLLIKATRLHATKTCRIFFFIHLTEDTQEEGKPALRGLVFFFFFFFFF